MMLQFAYWPTYEGRWLMIADYENGYDPIYGFWRRVAKLPD